MEVTTTYDPEVSPATKLTAPAKVSDTPFISPEIDYAITPEVWQIDLESHLIRPTKASFWDFDRAKQFHMQVGAGFPLASRATFHFATENTRFGFFSCGVDHQANFNAKASALEQQNPVPKLRPIAKSYDMSNRLYVGGGVFAGSQLFEAALDYKYDIVNSYAMPVANPDQLQFHNAALNIRFGDDFVNLSRLNFAIEAHGTFWMHPLVEKNAPMAMQFSGGGSVRLARDFVGNRVEINGGFDMWQMLSHAYSNMRYGGSVGYARDFNIIDLNASVGFTLDQVAAIAKPNMFVRPQVKITFDTGFVELIPYAEICSTIKQNGPSQLFRQNPFVDFGLLESKSMSLANTTSYDGVIGMSGGVGGSSFEYHIYAGAKLIFDQMLWYLTDRYTFGAATADNKRLFAGVELGYQPVGGLLIEASGRYHKDDMVSRYAIDEATLAAKLRIQYQIKGFKIYVSGDYTGERKWSIDVPVEEGAPLPTFVAKPSIDLRAGLSFRTSNKFEIYADGYNLLSNQIYDFAYYYRNALGFMVGVKVDF